MKDAVSVILVGLLIVVIVVSVSFQEGFMFGFGNKNYLRGEIVGKEYRPVERQLQFHRNRNGMIRVTNTQRDEQFFLFVDVTVGDEVEQHTLEVTQDVYDLAAEGEKIEVSQ